MDPQLTETLAKLTEQVTLLRIDTASMASKLNLLWWAFGACATALGGQFGHSIMKRGNNGYKDTADKIAQKIADKILNGKKVNGG